MPTIEAQLANGDKDDYFEWGIADVARAANRGVGPGEIMMDDVSNQAYIGQITLRRAQVAPPTRTGGEIYLG